MAPLVPQFLKALRQAVCELAIPDEQRRKSALLDEGMVQRQHHGLVVDYMKGMLELAGVPYLRLLNVPVPSVYGPTADENPFADA
jgi:hypothetical protein